MENTYLAISKFKFGQQVISNHAPKEKWRIIQISLLPKKSIWVPDPEDEIIYTLRNIDKKIIVEIEEKELNLAI